MEFQVIFFIIFKFYRIFFSSSIAYDIENESTYLPCVDVVKLKWNNESFKAL